MCGANIKYHVATHAGMRKTFCIKESKAAIPNVLLKGIDNKLVPEL